MAKTGSYEQSNICFDCRRACGGCSWSAYDRETDRIRFEPVTGWTAEPAVIFSGSVGGRRYEIVTWHITACPLFIPDPPRKRAPGELTVEQLKWMFGHGGRKTIDKRAMEYGRAYKSIPGQEPAV